MKAKILLITVFCLLVGREVVAQNGASPFKGSKHIYYINSADGGITHSRTDGASKYQWYLSTNLDGTTLANATDYTVEETNWDAAAPVVDLFAIHITWNSTASTTSPYYLFVEEMDANNTCITKRRIEINVQANDFDIAIADLDASCSDASGSIIVNDDESNLGNTVKTFTINMKTQADMTASGAFIPDWKFDYEVTVGNGSFVSVSFDDNTSDTNDGTANTGVVTVNNDDYSIQMTVTFSNVWNSADDVTVTLSNGVELTYNTPDGDPNNDEGTVTINALPNTSDIMTD